LLNEGDLLEIVVEGNTILLKPKAVVDRQSTVDELMRVLREPVAGDPFIGMSDDDIMREVTGLIREVRAGKNGSQDCQK
ncbi:MAG: hypothetical protein HQL55_08920, partial [Magnetococcales bacterium]|nr:hypothetical protein [Magnetococcales bacterium]